jgi:hypothetical protein
LHPALARAIASRAVGYQHDVVAIRTVGFMISFLDCTGKLRISEEVNQEESEVD